MRGVTIGGEYGVCDSTSSSSYSTMGCKFIFPTKQAQTETQRSN